MDGDNDDEDDGGFKNDNISYICTKPPDHLIPTGLCMASCWKPRAIAHAVQGQEYVGSYSYLKFFQCQQVYPS